MDDKIIAIFCLCDDLLKAMHHPDVGRPKTAKKVRCSYPECGPRHEGPIPISVPIRFGGACPFALHYPGQPDSTRVQRPG